MMIAMFLVSGRMTAISVICRLTPRVTHRALERGLFVRKRTMDQAARPVRAMLVWEMPLRNNRTRSCTQCATAARLVFRIGENQLLIRGDPPMIFKVRLGHYKRSETTIAHVIQTTGGA
jgi:hypothetical protein